MVVYQKKKIVRVTDVKRRFKKITGVLFLALILAFSMTACDTQKLDNPSVPKVVSEGETEKKEDSSTEKKAEDAKNKESASKDDEFNVDSKDDEFDVNSADDKKVDYSKYEEKTTKGSSSQGSGSSNSNSDGTDGEDGDSGNVTYSDGSATNQDQYQTDPVPEGMQNPVEPGDIDIDTSHELSCYFSISCATILDNMDDLTKGKETLVPADGMIFSRRKVTFYEGESVFDILQRVTKNNRIHMEFNMSPIYNSAYIEGINNLYEFDCGENSGWMYCVNGWYPNYGVSRYVVQDGDEVELNYTCDLGHDLGQSWME